MSITASGTYGQTDLKLHDGTDVIVDFVNDTIKAALYTNSLTPDFDADVGYSAAPYTSNEVTGTGYTAGGLTLASKTITIVSGSTKWDAADPAWSGATLTNVRGLYIYDDTITSKRGLVLVNLVTDYGVSGGTLTIQLSASGFMYTDNTP